MVSRLRSVLAIPQVYQLFFNVIGAPQRSRILVREYIQPKAGDRILEIGCGPGTIVPYLPECDYLGFDASASYIEQARKRYPRAKFLCERVSHYSLPGKEYFDIVLALAILHHLDDDEALQLIDISRQALKPGGRLITLDGVWTNDQSRSARYLLSRDRGQFVRSEEAYRRLASHAFTQINSSIRHDLLRIPYTHIILECVR
jgi:SAM-dependent methyltransferase